jgi:hypothetical protein
VEAELPGNASRAVGSAVAAAWDGGLREGHLGRRLGVGIWGGGLFAAGMGMPFEILPESPIMTTYKGSDRRPVRSINNTEHLVPVANRLLVKAGKGAWWMIKFLVGAAVRIPGWFLKANRRPAGGARGRSSGVSGAPSARR